jgi:hypothetical protein
LQAQQMKYSQSMERSYDRVLALEARIKTSSPDDEDVFFLKNDLQLAEDVLEKAKEQQRRNKEDLDETERLLKIVNDKLHFDRASGYIGVGSPPRPENTSLMMPPPPLPSTAQPSMILPATTWNSSNASMPPPPRHPPASMNVVEIEQQAVEPPLAKKPRVLGPSAPPSASQGSISGTLAFLSNKGAFTSVSVTEQKRPHKKDAQSSGQASFDSKKDEWRAPEGQDGSGLTKLNAKFAGRY